MPEKPRTDPDTPQTDLAPIPPVEAAPFTPSNASAIWANLAETAQCVTIVMGTTEVPFNTAMGWTEGSLIELDKVAGEPVDILVNGKLCARGEVVVISENFGVRITQIIQPP